jgi:hypothetical protein
MTDFRSTSHSGGYIQMDGTRPDTAWKLWLALSDKERAKLEPSIDNILKVKKMGLKGAVELLYCLGIYLSTHDVQDGGVPVLGIVKTN